MEVVTAVEEKEEEEEEEEGEGREWSARLKFMMALQAGFGVEEDEEEAARVTPNSQDRSSTQHPPVSEELSIFNDLTTVAASLVHTWTKASNCSSGMATPNSLNSFASAAGRLEAKAAARKKAVSESTRHSDSYAVRDVAAESFSNSSLLRTSPNLMCGVLNRILDVRDESTGAGTRPNKARPSTVIVKYRVSARVLSSFE